jgi:hypothetical protein
LKWHPPEYFKVPDVLRSFALRFREYVINRRRAPRFKVKVRVRISVSDISDKHVCRTKLPTTEGHTFDVSDGGIGLMVSSIRIGSVYLMSEDKILKLTLDLPDGPLEMTAYPVRYEPPKVEEERDNYLVGAMITSMSDEHAARYKKFLKGLS